MDQEPRLPIHILNLHPCSAYLVLLDTDKIEGRKAKKGFEDFLFGSRGCSSCPAQLSGHQVLRVLNDIGDECYVIGI